MNRYPHLLSPIRVGRTILKNRMIAAPCMPHFLQGPENFPSKAMIAHFAAKAKNGAALVTCNAINEHEKTPVTGHFPSFDVNDMQVQNYLSEISELIHFYDSKASVMLVPSFPEGYDVATGVPSTAVPGDGSTVQYGKEIPEELIYKVADAYAEQAEIFRRNGFDAVYLHMSYRGMLPSRFLSPLTNKRTDKWGGSLENRARFPLLICDKIKEKCGEDFLIELLFSAVEDDPRGWTLEDSVKFAKLCEGHVDMLQLRAGSIDPSHPIPFHLEPRPFLKYAEAVKEGGTTVPIVTIGGYQDIQANEDIIKNGQADIIAMARAWINNPDYGKKAYEGRGEDVVPCLRCNKCHISSFADPWTSVCSVNPQWGLEHQINIDPPTRRKRVAVVGGGPAGLEAAIVACDRGHSVTVYEESASLGGRIKFTEDVPFKWTLKNFKNYLIRQVEKRDIRVLLNTRATPEILRDGEYEDVIVAVGAESVKPPIPGIEGKNVLFAADDFTALDKIGPTVAIVGGGEVGVEAGIHYARSGRKVTLIEMGPVLAPDTTPIHYNSLLGEFRLAEKNLECITEARCRSIDEKGLVYTDKGGVERRIDADTVVIAAGTRARTAEAFALRDFAYNIHVVGDCKKAGNIQKAMRTSFAAASAL